MKFRHRFRSYSDRGAASTYIELLAVILIGAAVSIVISTVGGIMRGQSVDWRQAVEDASEQTIRLVDTSATHAEAFAECAEPVPAYNEPAITNFADCALVSRQMGVFKPPALGTGIDLPGWDDSVCVQTSGTDVIGTAADANRRLECWWHEPTCAQMRVVEVPSTGQPDLLVAEYEAGLVSVVPDTNGCSTWTCDDPTLPGARSCPRVTNATGGQNASIDRVEWYCEDASCFPNDAPFTPTPSVRMVLTARCSTEADVDECRLFSARESAGDPPREGEYLTRTVTFFIGQSSNAFNTLHFEPDPVIQFGVDAEDSTVVPDTCTVDIWHFLHEFDFETPGTPQYSLEYLNAEDETPADVSSITYPPVPIPSTYTFTVADNHSGDPPSAHWSGTTNGPSIRLDHGEYILRARYSLEVDVVGELYPGSGVYGPWSAPYDFLFSCPNTWRTSGFLDS